METPGVELSDGANSVPLKGANAISITASAKTERERGTSTVRFLITGDDARGEEPFNTLTGWYEDGKALTLSVKDKNKLDDCSLRESQWDPTNEKLYVTVYTRESAIELRRLFSP